MPDIKIKTIPISELIPYENNARTHSDEQIDQIAKSITEFGFNNPILLDQSNTIIAGHGRLLAAKKLGLTEVPTIQLSHLSNAKKKAYILADNRIALNAGWDPGLLKVEFDSLLEDGVDLALTGFDEDEISAFLNPEVLADGECDPDEVPELASVPITKLGDVWCMGKHRLMCEDSTNIGRVERLMNGEKANLIFTDPPYGVNFEQGKFIGRDKQGKDRNFAPIENDDKKGLDLQSFIKECLTNAALVSDVCSIYVWSPPLIEGFHILQAIIDSGWHIQSQIIWNKTPFVIGRADYHWKHEVCWYGYKGKDHTWHGGRNQSTIWDVAKMQSSDLHPTMKPVELADIALINSSVVGDIVLDLFGGSGTTLISCEKNYRRSYTMEISPNYCDVIIRRWQKFSGKEAILESTNQTFNEVSSGST